MSNEENLILLRLFVGMSNTSLWYQMSLNANIDII